MTEITITGGMLVPLSQAFSDLANNRLPFLLAVRVRNIADQINMYLKAWQDDIKPYLDEYGENGEIRGKEKIDAFLRAAKPQFEEEVQLEIDTLSLTELKDAFEGRDVDIHTQSIDFLVKLGVITS